MKILIPVLIFAAVIWYLFVYVPKQEDRQRKARIAAEYSKRFGQVHVNCIGVWNDANREYFFYEDGALADSDKIVIEVASGRDGTAYSTKEALADTQQIISNMPYDIRIYESERSKDEIFAARNRDKYEKKCEAEDKYAVDTLIGMYLRCDEIGVPMKCWGLRYEDAEYGGWWFVIFPGGSEYFTNDDFRVLVSSYDSDTCDSKSSAVKRVAKIIEKAKFAQDEIVIEYPNMTYNKFYEKKHPGETI